MYIKRCKINKPALAGHYNNLQSITTGSFLHHILPLIFPNLRISPHIPHPIAHLPFVGTKTCSKFGGGTCASVVTTGITWLDR